VGICGGAGSPRPFPSRPTTSNTAATAAAGAGGHPPSTPTATGNATSSNAPINKLKQFRAVATRYDKRDYMFRAAIDVASICIWLKDPVR
jgi:transposase